MLKSNIKKILQCQIEASKVDNNEASAGFDILVHTREVLDRDMQKWWQEYTTKINSYRSIRNQSLCTNPEALSLALDDIETNIEKVSYKLMN